MITLENHPLLDAGSFMATWPLTLAESPSPEWLVAMLKNDAEVPFRSDDAVRAAVRDLLRHGGFKPTGRSKPASEYLLRAASDGSLSPINAAVDACNVVSLHTGLPISVVDLERVQAPLRVAIAGAGQSYVFNTSGQVIELEGLVCLFDADGPCANAVKDSQRTKTHDGTRTTLSIVWGSRMLGDRTARATAWYREIVERMGATTKGAE